MHAAELYTEVKNIYFSERDRPGVAGPVRS